MDEILHVIDGEVTASADGATFAVEDPATATQYATAAFGKHADVDRAVRAAWAAFDGGEWRRKDGASRSTTLRAIAQLIRDRGDEIAEVESRDTGKPIAQARMEVVGTAGLVDYYAGVTQESLGTVYEQPAGFFAYSKREPYGVVGAIAPWNFPFQLAAWKVIPALAVGNSVVLKMAEQTPASSTLFAQLCLDAGLPPGALNVVHGDGTTGASLVAHPDVPKLTFTGSTAVGKAILRSAADHVKSVHLELGGKTPNIVFDDAPLDAAVAGSLFTSFFNSGQICTAGSRLLVAEGIADRFLDQYLERASRIRVGDPLDEATHMGPLISATQHRTVTDYIEVGLAAGATRSLGDQPIDTPGGYYIAPTVFEGVTADMRIAQEEIFGPVVSVIRFDDEDEAVDIANGVMYGLAATVWTSDIGRSMRMADRLDAGVIWTNCPHHLTWNVPYEGHKASGLGEDLGTEALRTFTRLKVHYVAYDVQTNGWA